MKACYQDEVGKRTHGRSPGQAMTAARIRCGRTSNKIGPLAAPGRLDAKQVRGLAGLDAAPEFLFGREQKMLVERIGRNGHFPSICRLR